MVQDRQNNQTTNPSAKTTSISIRNDFSLDEIQKMLGDINEVISIHKAHEQGIPQEDMVKTIRGGKVIWITYQEMNAILAKQRKITGTKYVQRSIRGENSLSSEINQRIEVCRSLIQAIRKVAPNQSSEFSNRMRTLEALQNLSLSHAHDVHILEMAIQRKKQEDPLLQEMDNATVDIVKAVEKNDFGNVDIYQSFCDRHMDEFHAKQKRLEPYRKKAAECRTIFLLNKQQIYQFQFELIEKGEQVLTQNIEEICYYDHDRKISDQLLEMASVIRTQIEQARSFFRALGELNHRELEEQKDIFFEADQKYLSVLFHRMISYVEKYSQAWSFYVEKNEETKSKLKNNESGITKISTRRMIYQEEKEKDL